MNFLIKAYTIQEVIKLTDQNLIGRIAIEDEYWFVRYEAVKKLTDQNLLGRIALEDEYWYVRQEAVSKLTDQNLLIGGLDVWKEER